MSTLLMNDERRAFHKCIAQLNEEIEQALPWESIQLIRDLDAVINDFENVFTALHDNMMRNNAGANAEAFHRMVEERGALHECIGRIWITAVQTLQGENIQISNNLTAAYNNLLNAFAALFNRMMDDAFAHKEACNRMVAERVAHERASERANISQSSHSSQNTTHSSHPSEFNRRNDTANMRQGTTAPGYHHNPPNEFNVQQQPSGLNLPRKTDTVKPEQTNQQNVHNKQLTPFTRIFSYTADHPTHTNQPYPALRNPEIVNMADFGGLVRTTIIIQVQNMAFERNPTFESDLADVLEALFSLPATDSYTGESTGAPAAIQVMRVSLPDEDKGLMDMLVGKWTVEVLSQEQAFVRVSVRPPLGLGRRAKKFFTSGCGIHNESSATAPLIMMDRHQFYIPFNTPFNHAAVRQYSEDIRKAAQASRHLYTDRLPSRPLKIRYEACKEGMDFLQEFPQR